MEKPREFWTNHMHMESSLSAAKDVTPKAEWVDLRLYVEHSAYVRLQAELAEVKAENERLKHDVKSWRDVAGTSSSDRDYAEQQKGELLTLARELVRTCKALSDYYGLPLSGSEESKDFLAALSSAEKVLGEP